MFWIGLGVFAGWVVGVGLGGFVGTAVVAGLAVFVGAGVPLSFRVEQVARITTTRMLTIAMIPYVLNNEDRFFINQTP
jgi:hypothetical protein